MRLLAAARRNMREGRLQRTLAAVTALSDS